MRNFISGKIEKITDLSNCFEITVSGQTMVLKPTERVFLKRAGFNNDEACFGEAQYLQMGDDLIKPWDHQSWTQTYTGMI